MKSIIAIVRVRNSDGTWKRLPLFHLDQPVALKVNGVKVDIALVDKKQDLIDVIVGDYRKYQTAIGRKLQIGHGHMEFSVQFKPDFLSGGKVLFSNLLGYSSAFHILLVLGFSFSMIFGSKPEMTPKKEQPVDVSRLAQIIKQAEKPELKLEKPVKKKLKKVKVAKAEPVKKVKLAKKHKVAKKSKPSKKRVAKTVAARPKTVAKKTVQKSSSPGRVQAARKTSPSPKVKVTASAAAEKALANSLSFLSSSSVALNTNKKHFSKVNLAASKNAAQESLAIANNRNNHILEGNNVPDGPVKTFGQRSLANQADANGVGGTKQLNHVQGKVADASLRGQGGDLMIGSNGNMSLRGKGSIPKSLIEKALEKYIGKLRYCYEKELLSDSSLAGLLVMQWTITGGGNASNVTVTRSQLNSRQLHSCVAQQLASIRFPAAKGGSVQVEYPFMFNSEAI